MASEIYKSIAQLLHLLHVSSAAAQKEAIGPCSTQGYNQLNFVRLEYSTWSAPVPSPLLLLVFPAKAVFLLQMGAAKAAYQHAASRLSEAGRSLLIAQDQQTVQQRTLANLQGQIAEGQKALTEVLGRQAAADRALLLDSDAARVWTLKEAERQKVEAQRAHDKAQKDSDRQVAEGDKALQKAMSRIASLEKQTAHFQQGKKVSPHVQPTFTSNSGTCTHLI